MHHFRAAALILLLSSPVFVGSQTARTTHTPYTATFKMTTVHKLEDGTTITRETTVREAHDSQGRIMRREDGFRLVPTTPESFSTSVIDPATYTRTLWTSMTKVATRVHSSPPPPHPSAAIANTTPSDPKPHTSTQKKSLGNKTIAGVYAEGIRFTTTIPTGYFGNDRPFLSVREVWTAPDLRLTVLTIEHDPSIGTRTTELINLDRSEPDPALFQPPPDYTIQDQSPVSASH